MADEWAQDLTDRIAGQIRKLREPKSVQWLEDRTVELGSRVSRSTISELETGRRKTITLADVLILAAALDVSLADLVYPGNGDVEILPGKRVPRSQALDALIADQEAVNRSAEKLGQQMNAIVNSMELKLTQIERMVEVAQSTAQDVSRISSGEDIAATVKAAIDNLENTKKANDGR